MLHSRQETAFRPAGRDVGIDDFGEMIFVALRVVHARLGVATAHASEVLTPGNQTFSPFANAKKLDPRKVSAPLPTQPIEYDSIDRKPVKLIVMLVSPPDKVTEHVQALGRLSRLMTDPVFREKTYAARSAQELFELFRKAETAG
jgi:hypothetical protein